MEKEVKFHICPDGTVGKCNAEKGNCPYQSTPHFDTELEAQEFADNENEAKRITEIELGLLKHFKFRIFDRSEKKFTLKDLGKSKSYLSRIEAIKRGYKEDTWENEKDKRVIEEIIKQTNTKERESILYATSNPVLIDSIIKFNLKQFEFGSEKNNYMSKFYKNGNKTHKIISIMNGYYPPDVLKEEDPDIKQALIDQGLFLREYAKDGNSEVSKKAIEKIQEKAKEKFKTDSAQNLWIKLETSEIKKQIEEKKYIDFSFSDNEEEIKEIQYILDYEYSVDFDENYKDWKNKKITMFYSKEKIQEKISEINKENKSYQSFSLMGEYSHNSHDICEWKLLIESL